MDRRGKPLIPNISSVCLEPNVGGVNWRVRPTHRRLVQWDRLQGMTSPSPGRLPLGRLPQAHKRPA